MNPEKFEQVNEQSLQERIVRMGREEFSDIADIIEAEEKLKLLERKIHEINDVLLPLQEQSRKAWTEYKKLNDKYPRNISHSEEIEHEVLEAYLKTIELEIQTSPLEEQVAELYEQVYKLRDSGNSWDMLENEAERYYAYKKRKLELIKHYRVPENPSKN